jgi:hypothetical protein
MVAMRFVPLILAISTLIGAVPDLFIGKWKLNVEASRDPKLSKSAIRTYQRSGKGVKVSEVGVDEAGREYSVSYTANYDGKDYPAFRNSDTVAFRRVDPYTVEGVSKTGGRPTFWFRRTVSKDGKRLTVEMSDVAGSGNPTARVDVYDRIPE